MERNVGQLPELDPVSMMANMLPPTADDVPLALDGTPLDTPAKLRAHLDEINASVPGLCAYRLTIG